MNFLDSEDNIRKLYFRVSRSYFKYTGRQDFEDCAQSVAEKMLTNKSKRATVDQFVIDYLRTQTGRKGRKFYEDRLRLITPKKIIDKINRSTAPVERPDYLLDLIKDKSDRAMVILTSIYGFTHEECASVFKLSTCRVAQRVQLARACIKRSI